MQASRSFLSNRGRFKSLHRRKTSADSNSTKSHSSARPDSQALSVGDLRTERRSQRASKQSQPVELPASDNETQQEASEGLEVDETSLTAARWKKESYEQFTEAQSEKEFVSTNDSNDLSEPRMSEETMKEVSVQLKPLQPLQLLDFPPGLESHKKFIDDDFIRLLGITSPPSESTDDTKKKLKADGMITVKIPKATREADVYEMEVPSQLSKPCTPELEVPQDRPQVAPASPIPQSAVSAVTPGSEEIPIAHLSIVSPVDALESPKPQRHFSPSSIEGWSGPEKVKKVVNPGMPSANSLSSAGTVDGELSGYSHESHRSSMSSVDSETVVPEPKPEGRSSVETAAHPMPEYVSLEVDLNQAATDLAKSPYQYNPTRPAMQRTGSSTSLRSTKSNITTADINKPLPPSPKRLSTISSIPSEESGSASRASMVTVRPAPQSQRSGRFHPTSAVRAVELGRINSTRSTTSRASLVSKYTTYTPSDLDALDHAFIQGHHPNTAKTSKHRQPQTPAYFTLQHLASNQSLADSQNLDIINEEIPRTRRKNSASSDVRQISRGPMQMQPTRKPPQLPPPPPLPTAQSSLSLAQSSKSLKLFPKKKFRHALRTPTTPHTSSHAPPRLSHRSNSTTNLETHPQGTSEFTPELPQRSTTLVMSSSSKADRILGRTPSSDDKSHNIMFGPDWVRSEASKNPDSMHASSKRDGFSPVAERSSEERVFNEVQKRMELLSPKADSTATFEIFKGRPAPSMRNDEGLDRRGNNHPSAANRSQALQSPTHRHAQNTSEDDLPRNTGRDEPLSSRAERQTFVAELEAPHIPREASPDDLFSGPIELPGSEVPEIAELGLPSPKAPEVTVCSPPVLAGTGNPTSTMDSATKRGRMDRVNPQSTLSAKTQSSHSRGSFRIRSLASIAASEIRDIYAHLPSRQGSMIEEEEADVLVSPDTAEKVLLRILESFDNFGDLFSAARVSCGFYRTFKRHELHLLKLTLGKMSKAAWELRQMSVPYDEMEQGATDYTPELYFRHYVRDMMTMVELKGLILERCRSFLTPDTIDGLAGKSARSQAMDEAFWRIWTFCRIFGCGNNREDDIVGQTDWLRGGGLARQNSDTKTLASIGEISQNSVLFNPPKGFAEGNGQDGLSSEELHDMFELWTCLGNLLQGFQGEPLKAREVGVFDNTEVAEGDAEKECAVLEEWTYYLLANAPSTILDVVDPKESTAARFSKAQARGHTDWTPSAGGTTNRMFLKEAIIRVSQDKAEIENSSASSSSRSFSDLPQVITPPAQTASAEDPFESRQRILAYGDEIRARKLEPSYRTLPVSPDRPMSDANAVLNRLDPESAAVSRASSIAQRFSRRIGVNKTPLVPMVESSAESSEPAIAPARANIGPNISERIASLHKKVVGREAQVTLAATKRKMNISPPLQGSLEKLPLPTEAARVVTKSSQIRDPVDVVVEKLVGKGYEEDQVKRVLAEMDVGDRLDMEAAMRMLAKQKKNAERMERLNKMG